MSVDGWPFLIPWDCKCQMIIGRSPGEKLFPPYFSWELGEREMTTWSASGKTPQLWSDFCPPPSEECWSKLWGCEYIRSGSHNDKGRKGGISAARSSSPSAPPSTVPGSVMGILVGPVKHGIGFIGSALMCFQHVNWRWIIVYVTEIPSWNEYNRIIYLGRY